MVDESLLGIDGLTSFESIGAGGFSTVYSAWDVVFQRRVAVKVLYRLDADGQRRFDRELRITGQLSSHHNVITPFQAGYTSLGAPYLVMEHVDGGSLADLVRLHGPLPWRRAVDYVVAVTDALAHAHGQGVLHRDVKPANILLAGDVPKLTDFGIAAIRESTTAQIAYTLAHCPPETFGDGHDSRDERSDLYSMASTLYSLIEGRAPFDVDSDTPDSQIAYMYRIVDRSPSPMRNETPSTIWATIEQGLAKDPDDRPQSAAAFAAALRAAIGGVAPTPTVSPVVGPSWPPPTPTDPPVVEPHESASSESQAAADPMRQTVAAVSAELPTEVETPTPEIDSAPDATEVGLTADYVPTGLPQPRRSRTKLWAVATIVAATVTVGLAGAYMALTQGDSSGDRRDGDGIAEQIDDETADASADIEAGTQAAAPIDLSGTEVTIIGSESSAGEILAIQTALDTFADEHDMTIRYDGSSRLAADLAAGADAAAEGPDVADIVIIPQQAVLRDLVGAGRVEPLAAEVLATTSRHWEEEWLALGRLDDVNYAVPTRSELKSLIWYQPDRFEKLDYEVPSTWEELELLTAEAAADGNTPWCVGLASGADSGWPFTDWVEDLVLTSHGTTVYDDWAMGQVPFSDPRIEEVMQRIGELWSIDGAVHTTPSDRPIGSTPFTAGAPDLVDGNCLMVRQGSFFSAAFDRAASFGNAEPDAIDVFLTPPVDDGDPSAVTWGVIAAATDDRPEVQAVMAFLGSAAYADERQRVQSGQAATGRGVPSGFLSAARDMDPALLSPIEEKMLQLMADADVRRSDASDAMPSAVGIGTFWTEGTRFADGEITASDAAETIDASWPRSP